MDENLIINEMPMFIIGGRVLLPNISTSFYVGNQKSLNSIAKSIDYGSLIFITSQKDDSVDSVKIDNLNETGVVCSIKKVVKLGNQNVRVFVDTLYRAIIQRYDDSLDYHFVKIMKQEDIEDEEFDEQTNLEVAKQKLKEYVGKTDKIASELLDAILKINELSLFINVVSFEFPFTNETKQKILDCCIISERFEIFAHALWKLVEFSQIDAKISEEVKRSVEKGQKEYYLREQLKAVHKELGDDENEVETLRGQLLAKHMPKDVEEKALKELGRMSRMSSSSPDYTVLRTYIDSMIELPFSESTADTEDLQFAIDTLNADHFGLEKVKKRIIEYIAVMKVTGKISGSILCLVGPPGVGKTSVASSIARALGRKFVRMSLGGVKDEAEIRGHRKTYIGAMPGRIINGLKVAGVNNPVFLLDEIDKLSVDLRGDPASALLEVLDPEQNKTFRDRYMEIPYDLSKVLFITTANSLETIPAPLLDRMEVLDLSGYTEEEKIEIGKQYLVPKRAEINGLGSKKITFTDEALRMLVKGYTLEAGVRNLERQIDGVFRGIVTDFAKDGKIPHRKVNEKVIKKYIGEPKFVEDDAEKENLTGAALGLAWTSFGGTTLTIEACLIKGNGTLILTGKLGDVMKESAMTALSFIRANADKFKIDLERFDKYDVHVHVPEGATPKDGPSAGITIATAILSAYTGKQVRNDVAMTGEITLRGNVLPIGGLKEKTLAAFRMGVKNVIIPFGNKKDIEDVPENIRPNVNFIPVKKVFEVFDNVLIGD